MDDVYLLNNPFTFQAMEKHSAYCAMMRLGLKVPETWLIPHKQPAGERALPADCRALQPPVRPRGDRREDRLPALHEAVRRRPVGRRDAHPRRDRAARRLRQLGRAADAPAGLGRGLRRLRAQPLDRRRDDGHELRSGPADVRPLPGRPRLPLARDRRRGRDDQPARQRVLPLGVQLLRDDRQGRRRVPDRLRERLAGRRADEPALLLPVGDPGARPLVGFCSATGRQMRINQTTRDYFEIGDREDLSYEEKLAEYRKLADAYFQIDEYERVLRDEAAASRRGARRVGRGAGLRPRCSSRRSSPPSRRTSRSTSSPTTAACSRRGHATNGSDVSSRLAHG